VPEVFQLRAALANAALGFVALAVVFGLLQRAYPARAQRFLRPQFVTDVAYFLGQYLLWQALIIYLLNALQLRLDALMPLAVRARVAAQPLWLQLIEVVFLSDFCAYWGHRLQHHSGFLWRFHAVHHSVEHLDWLAAHREHPLDGLYTQLMVNLPALVLGLRYEPLVALFTLRGMWAIFIHANVRVPLGPLRVLLGAPELHHWHHARDRFHGNYANISPLMDVLFGTYRLPPGEPESVGLQGEFPCGYVRQLVRPFQR
jgi:sterol desaturase/sphingolipid hydroxylase (fatty acid hydroxylase superfamily)